MIFEIPLEHFPQPFTNMSSTNGSGCRSNFIKSTGNQILTKMRESLSLDHHKPFLIFNDSPTDNISKSQTDVQKKRKLFAQKNINKTFSIDFDTNISLSLLKTNLCQSITNLKSQIFISIDQPPNRSPL